MPESPTSVSPRADQPRLSWNETRQLLPRRPRATPPQASPRPCGGGCRCRRGAGGWCGRRRRRWSVCSWAGKVVTASTPHMGMDVAATHGARCACSVPALAGCCGPVGRPRNAWWRVRARRHAWAVAPLPPARSWHGESYLLITHRPGVLAVGMVRRLAAKPPGLVASNPRWVKNPRHAKG